jgi:hypothetical protein
MMKQSLPLHLQELWPAWLACVLLPLPAMLFWHSGSGVALWLFFVGCTSLVAYGFRSHLHSPQPPRPWRDRMRAAGVALFCAFLLFSLASLTVGDAHDWIPLFIAFQILIPSFCVVPCLMLTTRKPVAAVVFTLFLVGFMKMLAGVAVNTVYGWGDGHHELPWTNPNLMLTMFWINSAILSVSLYISGARRYQREYEQASSLHS